MRDAWLTLLLILPIGLHSQVLRVTPTNPQADDIVTVIFDAAEGNTALKGYRGEVYAHTGVILGTVDDPSDWRYVQGEWGQADDRMRMKRIDEDLYQIQFQIRNFYGFSEKERFLQMAFVFRNENGSLIAKDKGEKDVFYPRYKVFEHGPLEKANAREAQTLKGFRGMNTLPDGSIYLNDGQQSVMLKSYGEGVFNVRYFPKGQPNPIRSEAVVAKQDRFGSIYEGNTKDPYRIAGHDPYNVRIHQAPTRLAFLIGNEETLLDEDGFFYQKNLRDIGSLTGVRFQLSDDEYLYGTGARALGLNLRGKRLYAYNTASYGYTAGEDDLNLSVPFVISSKGYGIFFDNPHKAYLDLGKSDPGVLEYGVKDSSLSYYVVLGKTPKEILKNYTRLTGRQPMPPMWALGYMQGRHGYKNQFEAEKVLKKTLDAGIPIDATLIDVHWFGGKEKMGTFKWDKKKWPNPERMLKDFKDKNVNTLLVSETYVVKETPNYNFLDKNRLFATDKQGRTRLIADFYAGPAALLDIFRPELADWLWPFYQDQLEMGVAGWWSDSGEPENHPRDLMHVNGKAEDVHNLYALEWSKIMYEKYKLAYPEQRFFNLQRSGYAGIQRYATFPWSGDVSRSWEAYRAQIPIMLGSSMSGLAYMHSNLGGYTGGPKDSELYRRWIQLGTFSPIMRVHGDAEGFEPEPVFFDPKTLAIAKKAIELRYKFLPYNYTLAKKNAETGVPLIRPMMMEAPDDPRTLDLDYQFFWGDALMVAPALEKGKKFRDVYFPKGEWFDFHTEELIRGGSSEKVSLVDDHIPLYVKRGSWIPMAANLKSTADFNGDSLELHYYPTPDGEFNYGTIYLDDGKRDEAYLGEDYKKISLTGKVKGYKIHAQITGEGKMKSIASGMNIYLHIHGFSQAPEYVKVFGKKVMISDRPGYIYSAGPESAYWDFSRSTVVVRVNWNGADTLVELKGYLK